MNEREKERVNANEKRKKYGKNIKKKYNKKKIINHLKTSFYCETSNDFNEEKNKKEKNWNKMVFSIWNRYINGFLQEQHRKVTTTDLQEF